MASFQHFRLMRLAGAANPFASMANLESLFGGNKAPAAPDYAGAAQQTAAGNIATARIGQYGNMVNQYTPQGSVIYTPRTSGYINTSGQTLTPEEYAAKKAAGENVSGFNPLEQWSQTVTMSPEQQAAYEKDVAMNAKLQDIGAQGLGYVQQALNKPLSFENMQAIGTPGEIQAAAADAAYKNAMRYVEPRLQRQQASLENQLANQGITRGSEAWNAAMQDAQAERENIYGQAQNQAYLQGLQGAGQAYQQALSGRQQQISEAQTLQQNPINMLNAVRTGSQLQSSQMPQVNVSQPGQLATVSGPDLLSATTAQGQYNQGLYNAQQAASGNQMSGLMGLAGTGMMAYAM